MSEYKGYRCPNCGQMIPLSQNRIIKCEYCGSEYEKEQDTIKPLRIEVCNAEIITLGYKQRLREEYLVNENIKEKYIEHTIDGIAHHLAKEIVPYTEVKSYRDLATMETIISGKVRIALNR